MSHALIVEDDANSSDMLAALVAAEGFSTATAGSLHDARRQFAFRRPDVVLLDLTLPDGSGMELFDTIERGDACEVVLITGHASLDTSIQALRLGAADYLLKPVNVERLRKVLARAKGGRESLDRLQSERDQIESQGRFGHLVGRSEAMREVYRQIARVAPTAVTALITGESGTGKEVVAQTIHELSKRSKGPFLAVNCGAISPQLIESELFGHEKGSFTGALRQHRGYFERADGGTLFLDEVTEMPLELQVKLLRVLETGSFVRIGADLPISTDVRIVAATNRAPAEAVAEGRLREDLFYRLNVFPIDLPPLRERLEDVGLLAEHFLSALNLREGAHKQLGDAARAALTRSRWPGNVRELRNAIQRAFILADGDTIEAADLPLETALDGAPVATVAPIAPARDAAVAQTSAAGPVAAPAAASPSAAAGAPAALAAVSPTAQRGAGDSGVGIAVGLSLAEAERRLILATLEHCAGHRERAAAMLGISPKTLYNRLKAYERDAQDAR